ncbi:MAG: hypothetical protein K0S92_401 [Desertimonas sp.]|nr:hypothetical protein [Desertimonas sp.]
MVTATYGIGFNRSGSAVTPRSRRPAMAVRVILAVALAGAIHVSSPASGTASAVCPPPGPLADIIAVDAANPGPLTEQFRPVYGVYAEGAASCWPGSEIGLTGHGSNPEGLGGVSSFTIEPSWLVSRVHFLSVTDAVDAEAGPVGPFLPVAVPPDLEAEFTTLAGRWVRVTGHFDDAIAETCVVTEGDPNLGAVPTHEQAVQICQTSFVLTSVHLTVPNTDAESSATPGGVQLWPWLVVTFAAAVAFVAINRRSAVR